MQTFLANFWPWWNGLPDASKVGYLALFVAPLCSVAVGVFAAIYAAKVATKRTGLEQELRKEFKLFGDKLDVIASRDETRFNYHFTNAADATKEIFKRASELLAFASNLLGEKSKPMVIRTPEDKDAIANLDKQFRAQLRAFSVFSHSVIYLFERPTIDALEKYYAAMAEVASIGPDPDELSRNIYYVSAMRALKQVENAFRQIIHGPSNNKSLSG